VRAEADLRRRLQDLVDAYHRHAAEAFQIRSSGKAHCLEHARYRQRLADLALAEAAGVAWALGREAEFAAGRGLSPVPDGGGTAQCGSAS
jgi:hypothetical protein